MSKAPASAPLALYAALTGLMEPLAPHALKLRAYRGKEDPARIGERLGRPGVARPPGPLVWLHGVSIGESLSLIPLVEAFRARRPDVTLLVTSATVTSAAVLASRLPPETIHQFAPVDAPGAVKAFLDHWRPAAAIFAESELWPNQIAAARRRGVRLALVSARMTEESAHGWSRFPMSAKALLRAFEVILPQDAETEARLVRLGATVGPRLSLKLAGAAPPADPAEVQRLRAAIGERKVVLAASTHPDEEEIIAEAHGRAAPETLLIVVPRHPERGEAVARLLTGRGMTVVRRSLGERPSRTTGAYVADTLGELGVFLRLANVAVMGGSFVPGVGGHNLLEPARLGAPIITGPHVFNAAQVFAEMISEVAAIEARDEAELARHIHGLLTYPQIARRIGEAALAYAERQGEAFEAALKLLDPLLPT